MRSTKDCITREDSVGIIVTLSPSHLPYLRELHDAGMTMARLNGSHNTIDWHRKTIKIIRSTIPGTPILLDIPGRKLRLNIEQNIPVHTRETIALPLPSWIPEGTTIIFDDGKLTGTLLPRTDFPGVTDSSAPRLESVSTGIQKKTLDPGSAAFGLVRETQAYAAIQFHQDGQLRPQIGMNIPSVELQGPLLTKRDLEIIDLAQAESVDYLGLSFIESAQLIHAVHQLSNRPCAVKIETQLAMQNLDDICQHADMVIVARGDLSVECGLFNVIKNQKQILKITNKIRVVATGLLDLYPPQQSTIADIQNAILDGADYLLVSSDLPAGKDAIQAIHLMKKTINSI